MVVVVAVGGGVAAGVCFAPDGWSFDAVALVSAGLAFGLSAAGSECTRATGSAATATGGASGAGCGASATSAGAAARSVRFGCAAC